MINPHKPLFQSRKNGPLELTSRRFDQIAPLLVRVPSRYIAPQTK
jgi:hypothetical protein